MPHYRIYNRLEFVRKRGIVSDGYGVPHRRVPFAGRHGGNVRGALVWNIRASGAIPHERLQNNMLAQRVATNGAAKVDEFLCEHLHLGVRDAVHAGKGRPVVDAGLFEKHHGRGADFPGFAGTRMCLDPRVLRGRRGELAANATAFRVGICALHRKRREMHDRLVEVAHVGCLVRRQLEIDALVGPRLVLQHATALSPEVPTGFGEDRVALELRVFDDPDGILHLAEVYVACDKILEDGDVVAFVQFARGGEPGIRRLARGGERRPARLLAVRKILSSASVRMVPAPAWALIVSALRSRIVRICARESGLMLRSESFLSAPAEVSAASPRSRRIRAISSTPTPFWESAFMKAFLMASTSRCESVVWLDPLKWTLLLIFSSVVSLARRTSPALYLPVATAWNCWIEMFTFARSGMVVLLSFWLIGCARRRERLVAACDLVELREADGWYCHCFLSNLMVVACLGIPLCLHARRRQVTSRHPRHGAVRWIRDDETERQVL